MVVTPTPHQLTNGLEATVVAAPVAISNSHSTDIVNLNGSSETCTITGSTVYNKVVT